MFSKQQILEDRIYKLYMHVNTVNQKKYIGITRQELVKRFKKNGNGYISSSQFYSAIKKHGWDKFKHYLILENLTKEEAEILEIIFIKSYKSNKFKFGYNCQKGGAVIPTHTESVRLKMSKSHTGVKLSKQHVENIIKANTGKKRSAESRKRISEGKLGSKNPMYKKVFSDEHKRRISENHPRICGGNHHSSKQIICIDTGEIFSSIREASIKLKLHAVAISYVCLGKRKTTGKLHFKYIEREV